MLEGDLSADASPPDVAVTWAGQGWCCCCVTAVISGCWLLPSLAVCLSGTGSSTPVSSVSFQSAKHYIFFFWVNSEVRMTAYEQLRPLMTESQLISSIVQPIDFVPPTLWACFTEGLIDCSNALKLSFSAVDFRWLGLTIVFPSSLSFEANWLSWLSSSWRELVNLSSHSACIRSKTVGTTSFARLLVVA